MVPTGFSLTKIDTRCLGASARQVNDSISSASAVPPAPSPSVSSGTKRMDEMLLTSAAGLPPSLAPRIHDVFQSPSTYLRKSGVAASVTRRPSRCETACNRLATRSMSVR